MPRLVVAIGGLGAADKAEPKPGGAKGAKSLSFD